jgi:RNA polymerase sigma factor (sigma-70 family)
MSGVHRLDPEREGIFGCAQAGCRVCQAALLQRHEGLIHFLIRRQSTGGVLYDDLVQEGRIALWRAVLRFDPQRGVAFSTYAGKSIERQIWQAVARARRQQQSWQPPEQADRLAAVEEAWHQAQVHTALVEAVAQLPERLQKLILARYGLDGQAPCTLQAIGQRLGVTKARIGQLHNDALVLLRLPLCSARLRLLCGHDNRAAYARTQTLSRAWQQRKRGRKQP